MQIPTFLKKINPWVWLIILVILIAGIIQLIKWFFYLIIIAAIIGGIYVYQKRSGKSLWRQLQQWIKS
jgi:energy-coupling factor transporter transmembrane protein EcfT